MIYGKTKLSLLSSSSPKASNPQRCFKQQFHILFLVRFFFCNNLFFMSSKEPVFSIFYFCRLQLRHKTCSPVTNVFRYWHYKLSDHFIASSLFQVDYDKICRNLFVLKTPIEEHPLVFFHMVQPVSIAKTSLYTRRYTMWSNFNWCSANEVGRGPFIKDNPIDSKTRVNAASMLHQVCQHLRSDCLYPVSMLC